MAKGLRLFIGMVIVLFPVLMGWFFRSPIIILILGVIYTPLYVLGKAGAWETLKRPSSLAEVLKASPVIFVIQSLLVSIFYLVGAGLGAIFTDRAVIWSVESYDLAWIGGVFTVLLPIIILIAYKERFSPEKSEEDFQLFSEEQEDADFKVLTRDITPETFYRSWHFSRKDYTGIALITLVGHDGNKPVRAPKQASETMIAQAEARLGVRFPETLRALYKLQDGGDLPSYYVPKHMNAKPVYDEWITAFACDYDDLRPLSQLETLYDLYMEDFDPESDPPEEKKNWLPRCEKLVILTIRTGYGTALDYREGLQPGVLLFDLSAVEPELKHFESFDAFLKACREIDEGASRDTENCKKVFGKPPNSYDADRFWKKGNAGTAITQAQWETTGEKLGVSLPSALLPFYKAANGGTSVYQVALPETNGGSGEDPTPQENNEGDPPIPVFPTGPYGHQGFFLSLEHWVSLATLSDRLHFVDNRSPWRRLYDQPEKLIVISAAFDSALMLDYRESSTVPSVLAIQDLDMPTTGQSFPHVENFLLRLRRYGLPEWDEKSDIGDDRISARGLDTESFWFNDADRHPVEPVVLQSFVKKWGFESFGLPRALAELYEKQNGGAVRFRFAPPQVTNVHG